MMYNDFSLSSSKSQKSMPTNTSNPLIEREKGYSDQIGARDPQ